MPADLLPDPYPAGDRLQNLRPQTVGPKGSFAEVVVTGEDPVSGLGITADRVPGQQLLEDDLIKGHRLLGDLRLAGTDSAVRIGAQHISLVRGEVDVFPLQPQHFADPQTGRRTDGSHQSLPARKRSKQSSELFRGEDIR